MPILQTARVIHYSASSYSKILSEKGIRIILFVAFMMMNGALLWTYTGELQFILTDDQSSVARYYGYPRYLLFIGIIYILYSYKALSRVVVASMPIWLLSIFFGITLLWCDSFSSSFRSYLVYLMQLIFGMALCYDFDESKTFLRLRWICAVFFLCSISFAVLFPVYGFETRGYTGALRGVFSGKNQFGIISTNMFAILIACFFSKECYKRRLFTLGLIVGSIALLFLSRSATSIVAAAIAMFAVGVCYILSIIRSKAGRGGLLAVAGALLIVIFLNAQEITISIVTFIGRDPTLTGRSVLWAFIHQVATQHSLFGYGFDSFWWRFVGSDHLLEQQGLWSVAEAHNTYLENYLSGGVIGVCVWVALLAYIGSIVVWELIVDPKSARTILSFTLYVQIIFQGNTESIFPFPMQVAGCWLTLILVLNYSSPSVSHVGINVLRKLRSSHSVLQ